MRNNASTQRAAAALCLISLFSCSEPCRQWEYNETVTRFSCFNSGKLTLAPEETKSTFELELVRCGSETRLYLNILVLEAPPHPTELKRTSVDLIIGDEELTVYPYLLKGGQRLLFSPEICTLIIQTLLEGQSFTIKMGSRSALIVPHHFNESYQQLTAIPVKLS